MTFTDEQVDAIDKFRSRADLAVTAGAGAGKTSTLIAMADAMDPGRTARYMAFNKSIVMEATRKMPGHVIASTVHSAALAAMPQEIKQRISNKRMASFELANWFRPDALMFRVHDDETTVIRRNQVAALAYRGVTIFCQSADRAPTERHAPYVPALDWVDEHGHRHRENNALLATALVPLMEQMWAEIADLRSTFPVTHDHYVKLFELNKPNLGCDVIFLDECQDVNPVFASLVIQQRARGTQLCFVGDAQQAIYEWRGAINAFELLPQDTAKATLSMSFRFGPEIAAAANVVLEDLNADMRIRGNPAKTSTLGPTYRPDAFVCRTNAAAVSRYIDDTNRGVSSFLMGGGKEMLSFARAAENLQAGRVTEHADLGCFETWDDVGDYVRSDPSGSELACSYRLVESFGASRLVTALSGMAKTERPGQTVITTTHRAKGREWATVELGPDFASAFADGPLPDEELRLLYVAATRAAEVLDVGSPLYFRGRV